MDNRNFHISNYNDDFLLIKSENRKGLMRLGIAIMQANLDFISEVICAETEICLKLKPSFRKEDINELNKLKPQNNPTERCLRLPVYFKKHDDWRAVLRQTQLNKEEAIQKIIGSKLRVSMFGFLPGFTYLEGLPEQFHIPRKSVPSKYVKRNSIALGGKYLGLYAVDSPGGWHVIGETPLNFLQTKELPPVPLQLEDQIKIEAIDQQEFKKLKEKGLSITDYNEQS